MHSIVPLLSLLALTAARPVSQTTVEVDDNIAVQEEVIDELNKQLRNVIHKKKFMDLLMEYVLTEYKGLTFDEREKVQTILEDLLNDVIKDFKLILEDVEAWTDVAVTRIGLPIFDTIHRFIHLELPDINDHNALRLAYRLERHLMNARQKIERVIKDSKKALIENS